MAGEDNMEEKRLEEIKKKQEKKEREREKRLVRDRNRSKSILKRIRRRLWGEHSHQ
jgi:hypothetical protein